MINIPDGRQKEAPKGGSKHKDVGNKEAANSKKGKLSEKSPQSPVGSAAGFVAAGRCTMDHDPDYTS